MLSLALLRFCFLPVLLFLSTSHLVNGQPAGSSYSSVSSSSTGPGGTVISSYNSNGVPPAPPGAGSSGTSSVIGTGAGAGPGTVRIVIQNGQISTIYSGPIAGFVSRL